MQTGKYRIHIPAILQYGMILADFSLFKFYIYAKEIIVLR